MMFEVQDLAVASPATVSRCGMVYLEPSILGLNPFVDMWLRQVPDAIYSHKDRLNALFDTFLKVRLYDTSYLKNNTYSGFKHLEIRIYLDNNFVASLQLSFWWVYSKHLVTEEQQRYGKLGICSSFINMSLDKRYTSS